MILYRVAQRRKDGLVVGRGGSSDRNMANSVLEAVLGEKDTEDAWVYTMFVPDENARMEAFHGCEDIQVR